MKIFRLSLLLTMGMGFLLITSQVFASPAAMANAKNTPHAKTPGAPATEKANGNGNGPVNKPPHGKHEHYKGTVSAVDANGLTVTLRDGSSATVGLDANTQIKFPGPKSSTPTSLQVGMNVMVQAVRDQSNNLTALRIMVIPGKPTRIHRVGIVTAYTAGASISIQDKQGNIYTFEINSDTKILPTDRADALAVGSRVTIIAPRDPATGGVTVKGIVVHPAKP